MRIAIFGDLHGRILLAFWLVKRWQEEHDEKIDLILSVGDIGIYSSFERMDKASRRFTEKYPEQLGFANFFLHQKDGKFARHPQIAQLGLETLPPLYFVPGNHEDHQFIGGIKQGYAADFHQAIAIDRDWQGLAQGRYQKEEFSGPEKIWCLPEGPVVDFEGDFCLATLEHQSLLRVRAINGLDGYTLDESWRGSKPGSVDLLLSHEPPRLPFRSKDGRGMGSERLRDFSLSLQPKWHFFGHMHFYVPQYSLSSDAPHGTQVVGLNQVIFSDKSAIISQNSFGILTFTGKGAADSSFELVADDWFRYLHYGEVEAYLV